MKKHIIRNTVIIGILCLALAVSIFVKITNMQSVPSLTILIENIKKSVKNEFIQDEPGGQPDIGEVNNKENQIIEPEAAREIIEETSNKLIYAFSIKDFETISNYVHPTKGVRFTPYTYVDLERDLVFNKKEIKNFLDDKKVYLWGYYDGSGEEIKLTAGEYYSKFIYSKDFKNAEKIGYNEVLSFGNALENQFEVYDNPIVVEYYFSGFEPEYEGLDWQSLRLVFEKYENNWYLVGVIHNQWTI